MKSTILIVAIIFLLLLPIVTADPTNETEDSDWYDSQWGGDTGDEEYTDPVANGTRGEDDKGFFDDLCGSGLCGSIFIFGICVPTYYLQKRKEKEFELE